MMLKRGIVASLALTLIPVGAFEHANASGVPKDREVLSVAASSDSTTVVGQPPTGEEATAQTDSSVTAELSAAAPLLTPADGTLREPSTSTVEVGSGDGCSSAPDSEYTICPTPVTPPPDESLQELVEETPTQEEDRTTLGLTPSKPAKLPTYCVAGKVVTHSRYQYCTVDYSGFVITHVPTGRVEGTATYVSVRSATIPRNSQTWVEDVNVTMVDATGWGIGTSYLTPRMVCSATCKMTATSPADNTVQTRLDTPVSGLWRIAVGSTAPVKTTQRLDLTYTNSRTAGAPKWSTSNASETRCEKLPYLSGVAGACVFHKYVPAFVISVTDSKAGKSAAFVNWAQQELSTHPGANYTNLSGPPLTRMYNEKLRRANQYQACKSFVPRSPTDSCDEYPFASTYQGASTTSAPSQVATGHVERSHNEQAGSYLQSFYQTHRLADGDRFYVTVVP